MQIWTIDEHYTYWNGQNLEQCHWTLEKLRSNGKSHTLLVGIKNGAATWTVWWFPTKPHIWLCDIPQRWNYTDRKLIGCCQIRKEKWMDWMEDCGQRSYLYDTIILVTYLVFGSKPKECTTPGWTLKWTMDLWWSYIKVGSSVLTNVAFCKGGCRHFVNILNSAYAWSYLKSSHV